MQNFRYYTPTKIVFGKDTEQEAGALVKEAGGTTALVHFGGGSAVRSGLVDRVCRSLREAGVAPVMLGGVVPNPRLSKVYEGIELCKKEGVDFILAVGGGSVIDSAKAIGYGLATDGDVWDFYAKIRVPQASAPVGCVLTLAATGSEMSDSSVITKEEGGLKRGCNNNLSRLKFAILNPALTLSLPWYQKASGAADIVMHTLERWFDNERTSTELTDAIAAALVKTVMRNILVLKERPGDYNAAAELMWAGSLSHNGLTGCGGTDASPPGDWACHQMEHELGGAYDVTHGAGLCAIWGSWARFVSAEKPARFEKLAAALFGIEGGGEAAVNAVIGKIEDFFVSIDMPVTISALGLKLSGDEIKMLAEKCSFFGKRKVGGLRPLDAAGMEAIFRGAVPF